MARTFKVAKPMRQPVAKLKRQTVCPKHFTPSQVREATNIEDGELRRTMQVISQLSIDYLNNRGPYLDLVVKATGFFVNPTDTRMVAGPPRIGESSGFVSQGV